MVMHSINTKDRSLPGDIMALLLLALALFSSSLPGSQADVFLYGARHEVPHYGYGYVGLDWPEEYATCSGTMQSPINVPGHTSFLRIPDGQESRLDYGQLRSTGSNIKVVNNGHTVQVVMPANFAPNTSVVVRGDPSTATLTTKFRNTTGPVQRVQITPTQFHFHTRGEHVIDGKEYPLELHIVNWVYNTSLPGCGSGGCATVVGVMFELADENDAPDDKAERCFEFLDAIWSVMPAEEGEHAYVAANTVLDFDHILPDDRSYITYPGSLTTPPCTEGILWHVMGHPLKITKQHLIQFELAVGATNCTHDNSSLVYHVTSHTDTPTNSSEEEPFEPPNYQQDPHDGLLCRKLAGVNYRDVQERDSRPLWFYTADPLCEPEILKMGNLSKAAHKLVLESNSTSGITLHQYLDVRAAGLTKSSKCAGAASSAADSSLSTTRGLFRNAAQRATVAVFAQAMTAGVLLCWLLLGG